VAARTPAFKRERGRLELTTAVSKSLGISKLTQSSQVSGSKQFGVDMYDKLSSMYYRSPVKSSRVNLSDAILCKTIQHHCKTTCRAQAYSRALSFIWYKHNTPSLLM